MRIKHIDRNSDFSLINNIVSLFLAFSTLTFVVMAEKWISDWTINDMLWLYYGARCIIAHGKPTKTMTEGSLRNFLLFYCWQLGIWPVQLQSGSRVQKPLWRVKERSKVHQVGIPRAYRMYWFFSSFGELLDGKYCNCIESPLSKEACFMELREIPLVHESVIVIWLLRWILHMQL